jgi:hypothetical protein
MNVRRLTHPSRKAPTRLARSVLCLVRGRPEAVIVQGYSSDPQTKDPRRSAISRLPNAIVRMSALGQKRTILLSDWMSALGPNADVLVKARSCLVFDANAARVAAMSQRRRF